MKGSVGGLVIGVIVFLMFMFCSVTLGVTFQDLTQSAQDMVTFILLLAGMTALFSGLMK